MKNERNHRLDAVSTTYDTLGRTDTQTNPAGLQVQNVYNSNGYLSQIRNAATLQVYWTATALSADGQLTGGTFGNGVTESRTLDSLGRTTAVNATHTVGTVTALSYIYDALSTKTKGSGLDITVLSVESTGAGLSKMHTTNRKREMTNIINLNTYIAKKSG